MSSPVRMPRRENAKGTGSTDEPRIDSDKAIVVLNLSLATDSGGTSGGAVGTSASKPLDMAAGGCFK